MDKQEQYSRYTPEGETVVSIFWDEETQLSILETLKSSLNTDKSYYDDPRMMS